MSGTLSKNNKPIYNDFYGNINNEQVAFFRSTYKIIRVDHFSPTIIRFSVFDDNFFKLPHKIDALNSMLEYYSKHDDKHIYEKADYLCYEKEKFCICNTNASILRKIYDGKNFKPDEKFASWFYKKT